MKSQKTTLTESDHFLRHALAGLLGLKLQSGASSDELRVLISECLDLAISEAKSGREHQGLDMHRLASVLRSWHKETRYLSKIGQPLPLPKSGKLGLRGLIGIYYPKSKIDAAFAALKDAALIKRYGRSRWLPTEGHVQMSVSSQESLDHVSEGVSRFLQTVLNNVNSQSKADLLFEKSCKVRKLPKSNLPRFREFVRQQAIAFLTAVDDWLEARVEGASDKPSRQETCEAGVFTFAYIDQRETPARNLRQKKR